MKTVSISDIQKNTAIFNNLTGPVEIIDKRQKKAVAIVYPARTNSIVAKLAGKYRNQVSVVDDLGSAKETAMMLAMEEKFGRAD